MDFLIRGLQIAREFIKTIKATDLIDIAIISYLIYKLLSLIRRTRTGQVAKGIFLVLAALWVSSMLRLNVINFFLGRTVEWGVLALVILFQPELRRFLEQMGSSSLGSVFLQSDVPGDIENAITQTVTAYTQLSRQKVGALTVFERKTLLDDILKTGTVLDAAVSGDLLKNIFWPKAPMHDGAVVIRNGRVAGAGCMLPLSSNGSLSRELGMRHRAGIGVSEHSDAVVVIVSEETGSISVAVEGMLKRHLAPETLERLLRNELLLPDGDSAPKTRFSHLFQKKKGGHTSVQKNP